MQKPREQPFGGGQGVGGDGGRGHPAVRDSSPKVRVWSKQVNTLSFAKLGEEHVAFHHVRHSPHFSVPWGHCTAKPRVGGGRGGRLRGQRRWRAASSSDIVSPGLFFWSLLSILPLSLSFSFGLLVVKQICA